MGADFHGVLVLVAGAAVIAVVGYCARTLSRWVLRDFRDGVKQVVVAEVAPIMAELRENGGESLRDSVNRIEHRTARIEKHLGMED